MSIFNRKKVEPEYESIYNLPEDEFFNRKFTLIELFEEAIYSSQITALNGDSSFIFPGAKAFNLGDLFPHITDWNLRRQEYNEIKFNLASTLREQNPEYYSDPLKAVETATENFRSLENYINYCDSYHDKIQKSAQVINEISFCLTLKRMDSEQRNELRINSGEYLNNLINEVQSDFYDILINAAKTELRQIRDDATSAFTKFKVELNSYSLSLGGSKGPAYNNYLRACSKIQTKIEKLELIVIEIDSLISIGNRNSNLERIPTRRIFILPKKDQKLFDFDRFKSRLSNILEKFKESKEKAEEMINVKNLGIECDYPRDRR